jgi:16S rRNA (guanine527-N7)-methyltransferase
MNVIEKYFPKLTDSQLEKFSELKELYIEWNEKINLISRKDIENLDVHHLLHSLAISRIIKFPDKARVIDVGTGGGFPGIPLAILYPKVQFTLIDSIGKKIAVVNDIVQKLELTNVVAIQARSNEYKGERFDFVVSRAVSTLQKFKAETKHLLNRSSKIKNSGIYYLKGGDFEEELKAIRDYKLYPLREEFTEDYFQSKYLVGIKN